MITINKQNVLDALHYHLPFDGREKRSVELIKKVIRRSNNSFIQSSREHFCGSGWVLSKNYNRVLLINHKKFNRWMQLGGHVFNEEDILSTAIREVKEESGIDSLELLGSIFDVDVHWIEESSLEPSHFHYDIRFLFRSLSLTDVYQTNQVEGKLKWFALSELQLMEESLTYSIARMKKKWEILFLQ